MTAIYARQSVDKADSISVELQIETCRARLAPEEVSETYTDKGFSGKNTDRPAFQRLLADVKAGRVEKILAYRLDRISRSVHDFTGLCQTLSDHGVEFQSCTDGITPVSYTHLERLCAAGSLRLRWVGRLIRADYTAPDGVRATLLLKPRAGGVAP